MSSLTLLAASMASGLFSAIWQGFLLIAVMALCLRLMPALTAAIRSFVWLTITALTVLLPFVQTSAPFAPGTHTLSRTPLYIDSRWTLLLAAVWAVASFVRAVQLAAGAIAIRRLSRTAIPVAASAACATLLEQSRRAESRPAELCISTEVDRPSVLGFFRPRILLPTGLLDTLSVTELQQILLHELEHLRRRDDWANLLGRLALVVFPLNPVLLWLERRLATERELACDDRVLETTGAPKAYATCLAHLAEHTLLRRGVSLALALVGVQSARPSRIQPSPSELARRVTRILTLPTRTLSPRSSAAVAAGLITLITGGSVELAQSPQLIQFKSPAVQLAEVTRTRTRTGDQLLPVAYSSRISVPFISTTKALLTDRRPVHPVLLKAAADTQRVGKSRFRIAVRPSNSQTPLVRLTSFYPRVSGTAVYMTFSVTTADKFSYTAVQVHGGWIFVLLPAQAAQPVLTLSL